MLGAYRFMALSEKESFFFNGDLEKLEIIIYNNEDSEML
jgi:hypothetical protein